MRKTNLFNSYTNLKDVFWGTNDDSIKLGKNAKTQVKKLMELERKIESEYMNCLANIMGLHHKLLALGCKKNMALMLNYLFRNVLQYICKYYIVEYVSNLLRAAHYPQDCQEKPSHVIVRIPKFLCSWLWNWVNFGGRKKKRNNETWQSSMLIGL